MSWKVRLKTGSSVNIAPSQLVNQLLSTAVSKESSEVELEENSLVVRSYQVQYLPNIIDKMTIGQMLEIAFVLGRTFERFKTKNEVTFESPGNGETTTA